MRLPQFGVPCFRLLRMGISVGVFPEREEILIGGLRLADLSRQHIRARLAETSAWNLNNKGQVVGRLLVPDAKEGGVAHAFLWQDGVLTDLGVPAGDDNSEANSLNNGGQIVGDSGVGFIESYAPDRALLWQNGARTDLNTLVPSDSGYHLIVAFDVNARGEIVACAVQLSSGNIHAALLSPQPANIGGNSDPSGVGAAMVLSSLSPRAQHMLDHARHMKSGRGLGLIE